MQLSSLLNSLAASLSQQDWTAPALEIHLAGRLPAKLSRFARPMARELVQIFPKGVAPDASRIAAALRHHPATPRLWAFAIRSGTFPAPPLSAPAFRPDPALAGLDLPALATPGALADWLWLTPDQLVRFADLRRISALSDGHFGQHYRHQLLPKKDGRLRLIEEPKPLMKRLQRRVLRGILDHVAPHPNAYGFVRGQSCIGNAARHAGEAVVLNFDLSGFFPGIGFRRVYGLFRTLGYPAAVARALTGLCTSVTPPTLLATPGLAHRDVLAGRHLPQGAPTSPALANLSAHALDRRLTGLARSLSANYSRYADDLSFSGDARIGPILLKAVPAIVQEEGFHLNPAKTRIAPAHTRQTVTGITVNRHVNIARADYDRLKATIHHLGRPSDPRRADPAFLARLSGRIAWVEAVNPRRGLRLRRSFEACFAAPDATG